MEKKMNKYVSHEITKTMFENNKNFYEDVVRKNFDIELFERSFKKTKMASETSRWFSRIR